MPFTFLVFMAATFVIPSFAFGLSVEAMRYGLAKYVARKQRAADTATPAKVSFSFRHSFWLGLGFGALMALGLSVSGPTNGVWPARDVAPWISGLQLLGIALILPVNFLSRGLLLNALPLLCALVVDRLGFSFATAVATWVLTTLALTTLVPKRFFAMPATNAQSAAQRLLIVTVIPIVSALCLVPLWQQGTAPIFMLASTIALSFVGMASFNRYVLTPRP